MAERTIHETIYSMCNQVTNIRAKVFANSEVDETYQSNLQTISRIVSEPSLLIYLR